jgi:flagellar FliL protein
MAKAKKSDKDTEEAAEPAVEDGAEGAPAAKKKLPLKLIIIGAAGLLLLGGGGFAGYKMLWHSPEHAEAVPVAKPAVFVDTPEVLVNFANPGGERTQYLKIKMTFELPDQALMQQIQPLMPRVMDAFQTYLRELRPSDLEGSAGLYRLKEELTRRVNAAVAPNHVNAVLFKEIVIQ